MRTVLALSAAAALFAFALATGCGTSGPCNANSCEGCCSQAGVCRRGVSDGECGSAGRLCDVCSNIQHCASGVCTSATGGGAGGGGGGTGGGGALNYKRVFVTNATYTGNLAAAGGMTTGLAGGDALCSTAATAAALGGTWKAWLSDGTTRAIDRITAAGPWKKLDTGRTTVFNNKANLATLPLVPIDFNENGVSIRLSGTFAWTGTDTGGIPGVGTNANCAGWTNGAANFGDLGNPDDTTTWTQAGNLSCDSTARLYCLEQ